MSEKKPESILIINAGSSSIKFALYRADNLVPLERKKIEIKDKGAYEEAFKETLKLIDSHNVTSVGHRVVHGGKDYAAPQKVDAKVYKDLEDLTPLAPLHQPHNLKAIRLVMDQHPDMPQVACFDTAFHRSQPRLNQIYALPRNLSDEGIIRYGFHGLSYEYISTALQNLDAEAAKARVIVAHLGSGASLCAMKDGKSVATTMGFTPNSGLMMGTRTGDIDVGVAFHLMEQKGMTAKSVSDMFQKSAGLKGVSGISLDMRELLADPSTEAREAVDLFCLYAARQVGSLAVDLGGLDVLVFTAGIGENSDIVREKICKHLEHLGVKTDRALNKANGSKIGSSASAVKIYVIKTDEELMMAQHAKNLLQSPPPSLATKVQNKPKL